MARQRDCGTLGHGAHRIQLVSQVQSMQVEHASLEVGICWQPGRRNREPAEPVMSLSPRVYPARRHCKVPAPYINQHRALCGHKRGCVKHQTTREGCGCRSKQGWASHTLREQSARHVLSCRRHCIVACSASLNASSFAPELEFTSSTLWYIVSWSR